MSNQHQLYILIAKVSLGFFKILNLNPPLAVLWMKTSVDVVRNPVQHSLLSGLPNFE